MNGEKLFKSMNNINQEWIEQAKPANKPVIMRTRSKIYRNIAAAAAAVIAISGLTYTVYTRTRSILSQRVMSILNLI